MTLVEYVTEIAAVNQALLVVCLTFSTDASTWAKKHGQSPITDAARRSEEGCGSGRIVGLEMRCSRLVSRQVVSVLGLMVNSEVLC